MTVQTIIDASQRDAMNIIGANHANLIDYVNRAQLMILREKNWKFMESGVQQFLTAQGQTQYYISSGTAPAYTVDTHLALSDFGYVMRDSVKDISNERGLFEAKHSLLDSNLRNADGSYIYGKPAQWRNAPDSPTIFELYPAPDNQNAYVAVPESPYVVPTPDVASFYMAGTTYYVWTTFSLGAGATVNQESLPSRVTAITPLSDSLPAVYLTIHPPVRPLGGTGTSNTNYTHWNAYVGTTSTVGYRVAANTLLSSSVTQYTLPAGTEATLPTVGTIPALGGYIINFKYYKAHTSLSAVSDTLLIPDRYFDVVVSAVNLLACQYVRDYAPATRQTDLNFWSAAYSKGIRTMILEENAGPRSPDYISVDPAAVYSNAY